MKKSFLFLVLSIGLANISSADYLDDWSDKDLCGWMENPSPPSYMVEEVKTRGISCSWGVATNNSPDLAIDQPIDPNTNKFTPAPGYKYKEFTQETWLSNYGLMPEDLSPMLLELGQRTQKTTPECTIDFCFTMEPEYAASDEILNQGHLINLLYRYNSDIQDQVSGGNYCVADGTKGKRKTQCYMMNQVNEYDEQGKYIRSTFQNLFPTRQNGGTERIYTGDDWLKDNGFTTEDLVNMIEDIVSSKTPKKHNPEEFTVEYALTDEIINTDQLIQSLLFWDPNALGPDLTHTWEGSNKIAVKEYVENIYAEHPWLITIRPGWKILENTDMWVIDETDPYWQTPEGLKEKPPKIDPGIVYPPESLPGDPTIPNPKDYRPGWKIQEGSNFWVIDEADPYWQTESGSEQKEKIKRLGSAYAKENPGVDPPIPSYYATDGCSEGKQEPGASCNR